MSLTECTRTNNDPGTFFICHEESQFFSLCIDYLVLKNSGFKNILEYGSGDGLPVLEALSQSSFDGEIKGYEINEHAYQRACLNISNMDESNRYIINKGCFFKSFKNDNEEKCIIANPPYVPAPEKEKLILPYLWGGYDGSEVLKSLFNLNTMGVMILIPSISNPEDVINHGVKKGYNVVFFLNTTLPFGTYTSQEYVKNHLSDLKAENKSYFRENHYFLSGALFLKDIKDDSRTKSLLESLKC